MSKKLAGYGGIGIVLLVLTLLICLGIGSVALPIRDIDSHSAAPDSMDREPYRPDVERIV